jgi:hypothetical protein
MCDGSCGNTVTKSEDASALQQVLRCEPGSGCSGGLVRGRNRRLFGPAFPMPREQAAGRFRSKRAPQAGEKTPSPLPLAIVPVAHQQAALHNQTSPGFEPRLRPQASNPGVGLEFSLRIQPSNPAFGSSLRIQPSNPAFESSLRIQPSKLRMGIIEEQEPGCPPPPVQGCLPAALHSGLRSSARCYVATGGGVASTDWC